MKTGFFMQRQSISEAVECRLFFMFFVSAGLVGPDETTNGRILFGNQNLERVCTSSAVVRLEIGSGGQKKRRPIRPPLNF